MSELIRVSVVHPSPTVRERIRDLLEIEEKLVVISITANCEKLLTSCLQHQHDVLVVGMHTPDWAALELVRRLKLNFPEVKILVLADFCDETWAQKMMAAGASGYLLNEDVSENLIKAFFLAADDVTCLSKSVTEKLVQPHSTGTATRTHPDFSEREREVLQLIVDGKTNGQIAHELGVKERTVEFHVGNILQKLDVSSRVEAAVLAVTDNLL